MSEMRFNPITRDWVIMAEHRAGKPGDFAETGTMRHSGAHRDDCPFCPGNESLTTDEISRIGLGKDGWKVRVVWNKYPALRPDLGKERNTKGLFRSMRAGGCHEVIVDHPRHDVTLASAGSEHLAGLIRMYRERYAALRKLESIESITLFRNHGVRAGTSLEHPHTQIIAAPIVPPKVRKRIEEAIRFHDETGDCIGCRVLAEEIEAGERIVETSDHFVGFVPHAALSPFCQWIFPRRHAASFDSITNEEIADLAAVLSRLTIRLRDGVGDPDFNISLLSAPTSDPDSVYFHWYLAIIPRISRLAGFEMSSGVFVNPVAPERAAETLRGIRVESPIEPG